MYLAHQKRKSLRLKAINNLLFLLTTTIEKNILLTRVTMHVNEHSYLLILVLS